MKKNTKLWVYSELFYPEETSTSYIMTKICNKLAEKYDVEVVCGFPSYDKNKSSDYLKLNPDIKLKRIKSYSGDKDKTLSRILKLLSLSFGFFFHLLFKVKSGDKIFTVTNPATFLVFASIVKRFKKIDVTILVHDVFPENTLAGGFVDNENSFKYKIVKSIFDKAYSTFDNVIVLGRDMKDIFNNKLKNFHKKPTISIIENWADVENIFPEENIRGASEKIVFQFAGNLGSIQGLDSLIEIIGKIANDNLSFEFVGSGKMKPYLEEYVEKNRLKNVSFKPPYSRTQQNQIINSCTIAIVTLSDKMLGLGVPSKTYNILAAGKPILYIGDKSSEVALLIDEYNIGYHFKPGQKEELLNFFNQITTNEKESIRIKGLNARNLAVSHFSEEIILNKFKNIV
ncbi:glycosyltransferase family 4 protein [Chryseobacterium sp. MYb264]|uniref:glycosyltransferase family 4 protein n=1 Tax=Chryseobacterium sp. MYb264 TaxID=2745153 RepID=UPI002E130654|nr:glycosyltransferase family 4 protein [Chryseobacterium sp. MYb264]